jgi:Protein of unknown function (DUF3126)
MQTAIFAAAYPLLGQGTCGGPQAKLARPVRKPIVDKAELQKLQEFLRKSLANRGIKVTVGKSNPDDADVHLGERRIGTISVDDEDGDRSFAFAMKIPVERPVLQDYLRRLFETDKLKIVPRGRKTDSVELNNGDDFLGVISADDPKAKSFTLQMAILDIDLDEL